MVDQQRRLVDVNPAVQALMGSKDSELIGQPIADLLPAWSELVERQDSRLYAEIVIGEGDGLRHVALSEQPIRDRREHLAGYLVVLCDISERKSAEERLAQEKRISEEIVDNLLGVFYMNDSRTALVRWNRRLEQVTGYTAEELAGKQALDFFLEEDRTLVASGQEKVFAEGQADVKACFLTRDGPTIPDYFTASRIGLDLAAVLIIAVTASAFEEDQAAVLGAGCDDFVRKPFRESEVLEVTAKHMGIEYLYQQLPGDLEGEGNRQLFVALTPDDLNDLPDAWVNDLSQAARRGRAGQVLALIEGIERERPQVAWGLRALVRESRFLDIVTAAEGSRDGR